MKRWILSGVGAVAASTLFGCQASPDAVPWRGAARIQSGAVGVADAALRRDAAPEDRSTAVVWVSYQLRIEAVDGRDLGLAASGPCVYYRWALPPGRHRLRVRLDYAAPVQDVRSAEAVTVDVDVVAGREYRLLDLGAGTVGPERRFVPWLRAGAPPEGVSRRRVVGSPGSSPPG